MNKLGLIISVLCISISSLNWGMLTVGSIQNPHAVKKLFTQEKLEKETQIFLDNFGQQSINDTGKPINQH